MDQNSYKFCTSFNTIFKKLVRTQFSQLKISMTLPVLSYRLSSRSNHSDISLFTWTDLMRSSRFTCRGQMQNKKKIMATIPFMGSRKIYQKNTSGKKTSKISPLWRLWRSRRRVSTKHFSRLPLFQYCSGVL